MGPLLLTAALLLSVFKASCANVVLEEWQTYKAAHDKFYQTPAEDARRLETYLANKRKVDRHNARYQLGETTFTMAINKFSDWFPEEISRLNGLRTRQHHRRHNTFRRRTLADVPESINWVEEGAVTSVKDQGNCGSCYAFSAIGALEGLMFRTNRTITDLSTQQLVDCSPNYGCDGGLMTTCFEYVISNDGIEDEKSYPYEATNGTCRFESSEAVASCTSYEEISLEDEDGLREAVGSIGPVSIGFAVGYEFFHYSNGIFDGDCSKFINHGMLAVGYGKDNETGEDYWLVKNSWGVDWGEEGYVRVKRNVNLCGIADEAAYPKYD